MRSIDAYPTMVDALQIVALAFSSQVGNSPAAWRGRRPRPAQALLGSMNRRTVIAGFLALVLSFVLVARLFSRGGKPYSTDIEALRTRFNDDHGTVRLLLLLSPT